MINDVILLNYNGTDGAKMQASSTETGSTRVSVDINLPANSVDVPVSAAFIAEKIQSLIIVPVGGDITLKTNNAASPDNTFYLKAGLPLTWRISLGYFANPFTTDNTGWFVSCNAAARLQAILLTM